MPIDRYSATAAAAATNNVILAKGQLGYTADDDVLKVGDGVRHWNDLEAVGGGGGGADAETIQDLVGAMVSSNTETRIAITYDDAGAKLNAVVDAFPVLIQFAFDGALTTGAGTRRIYNPTGRTITIKQVTAHVVTAPTGAAILLDVNIGGTTVFTTQGNRPSIAISGNVSTAGNSDAAASTLASGGYLTVDVDQIGSTVAGSDLTGVIYGEI